MDPVPSSVITAIALSAAAGKNPWVPLGLLFLFAAPDSIPDVLMDPALHAELHQIGPPSLLWTLAGIFVGIAVLESLADKIPWVERWLVPVSTSWRPFAAITVATIVGVAATGIPQEPTLVTMSADVVRAGGWLLTGSIVVTCIAAGAVYGWIATVGKTGTRLLLSMVPVPSLRLAHSFLDDLFAIVASFAGFALSDSLLLAAAALVYLVVGIAVGPILTRLTIIHVRIGVGILRKLIRGATRDAPAQPRVPKWVSGYLAAEGLAAENVTVLPAYTYRAPRIGRCRAGYLVIAPRTVAFVTRIMWRPRAFRVDAGELARIGLASATTNRSVTIVSREEGRLREAVVYLFPAFDDEILPLIERGAEASGLVRVRPHSPSARHGVPGFDERTSSPRYAPPEKAGSLRAQALTTIAAAVGVGVLTGGVHVPIGAGYLLSPFPHRFLIGFLVSVYLSLCVVGTFGAGWPVAVLYAIILNTLALRDLTRAALKARIDGFVDRRAFLPPVAERVWVPASRVLAEADRWQQTDGVPITDGPWRTVFALLRDAPPDAPPRAAPVPSRILTQP